MVIDYSEFEFAREMREDMRDYEALTANESAYDGYPPLGEEEMDGYHIVCDNEKW